MAVKKRTVLDRLRTAFKAKDEAAFEEELNNAAEEMGGDPEHRVVIEVRNPSTQAEGETAVEKELEKPEGDEGEEMVPAWAKAMMERLDKIEAGVAKSAVAEAAETSEEVADEESEPEEKKEEREEEKKEEGKDCRASMDKATVETVRVEFQDVVAKAEILAPGVKLATFDAKGSRKTMADAMCGLRKRALEKALADDARKGFVTKIAGEKPDLGKMTCDHMAVVFNAASELARAANNSGRGSMDHQNFPQGKMTTAKLQELNASRRKSA